MGGLEHGGNATFSGLPAPYYIQLTAAWQQIPFVSATAKLTKGNPVLPNVNGRRRFIFCTQPVWLSGDPLGATAMPVPANMWYETTTRSALYVKAAGLPFDPNPATSSSSGNFIYSSSSSSGGFISTFGFLYGAEEGV